MPLTNEAVTGAVVPLTSEAVTDALSDIGVDYVAGLHPSPPLGPSRGAGPLSRCRQRTRQPIARLTVCSWWMG